MKQTDCNDIITITKTKIADFNYNVYGIVSYVLEQYKIACDRITELESKITELTNKKDGQ